MTIVGKRGAERVRELQLKTRCDGDLRQTTLAFTRPADLQGFRLLQIEGEGQRRRAVVPQRRPDPAHRGRSGRGALAGSDFTFEDLRIRDALQGTHAMVEETPAAWIIDTTPPTGSAYTRIRSTIDRATLAASRLEMFAGDAPVKRLEVVRTERAGDVWLPVET